MKKHQRGHTDAAMAAAVKQAERNGRQKLIEELRNSIPDPKTLHDLSLFIEGYCAAGAARHDWLGAVRAAEDVAVILAAESVPF